MTNIWLLIWWSLFMYVYELDMYVPCFPFPAKQNADLQEDMLTYLGPHLHCTMQSRRSEQEYLRRLVEKLFPYILRPQALQSK